MKQNYVHRIVVTLMLTVLLIMTTVAFSPVQAAITPIPLPDPGIPGFKFPTPPEEIISWTEDNNQTAINQHAWGIWTALTAETDQTI